jgi:hypothetical protein
MSYWYRTSKELPPDGTTVIALIRVHYRDRSKGCDYTQARAIYRDGKFKCGGEVLWPVRSWKYDLENPNFKATQPPMEKKYGEDSR